MMVLRVHDAMLKTLPLKTRLWHIHLQTIHITITSHMNLFACCERLNVASLAFKHNTVAFVANVTYRHQGAMYISHLSFECDFLPTVSDCHDMLLTTVRGFVAIGHCVLDMFP